jgi:branched-chain amino acid transport system substrate-binding protein
VEGDVVAGGVDRRRALKLLGGMGVVGLVSACASSPAAEPAARLYDTEALIGLLVPGTGGLKPIGDDMINGFTHYVNGNGGRLGGHPAAILVVDEGDSPDSALAALAGLLEAGVHAIAGVASSAAMLPIAGRIEEELVPLLGANASPEGLHGTPYIWRTSFVNDQPGEALGRFLASQTQGTVAVISQDDPMGTDAVAGLRQAFAELRESERLETRIFTPSISQPSRDHFSVPLQQIRASDPETVFACYAGTAAIEFVRQYLDAGLDPSRLTGPAYLTEGAVLAALGADALGIRTSANYAPELRTPTNRAFASDYRRLYGEPPTIYSVAAYDAAGALDKAIGFGDGVLNPQRINVNLARVGLIDSPRGRWQFNQSRTPTQKWYLREVGRDGPVLANIVLRELGTLG